mgnify:CR=1 FL=1
MAFLGLDKLAGYVAGGAKLADKTAKDEGKLLYPSFLNYDLSADDNWSIVSGQNKYVVADIVREIVFPYIRVNSQKERLKEL